MMNESRAKWLFPLILIVSSSIFNGSRLAKTIYRCRCPLAIVVVHEPLHMHLSFVHRFDVLSCLFLSPFLSRIFSVEVIVLFSQIFCTHGCWDSPSFFCSLLRNTASNATWIELGIALFDPTSDTDEIVLVSNRTKIEMEKRLQCVHEVLKCNIVD